jgi:hypothetical protein
MAVIKRDSFPAARNASHRRIIAVVVPPIDELDLVGPLQVLNSANRLAGRKIYAIEVVTNAKRLTVKGEGGVLTFVAKHHFSKVEGTCDSVLLVCGLGTRSVRDAALSAWLKRMATGVRRLGAVCVRFVASQAVRTLGHKSTMSEQANGAPIDANTFVRVMLRKMKMLLDSWTKNLPTIRFFTPLPNIGETYITGDHPVVVLLINDNEICA